MYTPKHFQENDREVMFQLIQQQPFALLVMTSAAGIPVATHIPVELQTDPDGAARLVGHVSKANPQAKLFGSNVPALAVFSGPHAYISASWYNHINVPTWNYIAVHAYGPTRVLTEDETLQLLRNQTDRYEKASACPVSIESMTEAYVRKEMRGLVAFSLAIDTLQGTAKLSQNRDDTNHAAIVENLRQRADPDSQHVADEMVKRRM